MAKILTNKLSIYLIKEEYASPRDIFRDHNQVKKEAIDNIGTLYYKDSYNFKPSWMKKFFGELIEANIFNSTSRALLLIQAKNRYFAITFGYGHMLLSPGTWEERFGLKTALNIIDHENLRSIDKKNMSVTPKLSKEQVVKDGTFADFGVDIEQDLIQGITGKSKDKEFGKTITGKDALNISVKINASNIKQFLERCLKKYDEDGYKKHFGWIDNISEIKDPEKILELDENLVNKIKKENFEKIWMAIPEIIDWQNVSEFKFKRNSLGNDIDIRSYLKTLSKEEKEDLSLRALKKHEIRCIDAASDKESHCWKVYNCLYCESENEAGICILNNGKWYRVDNDFVKTVSETFSSLLKSQSTAIDLPECFRGEHENNYNERVANKNQKICNMDGKNIHHGGSNQKIEFCDLLTKQKQLIHVKHYGSSAVFSHLFSQGLVSGELFLTDKEFRKKLNDILPESHKIKNINEKPDPREYKIIFAVISKSDSDLDIPFFSKVNIRNTKRRLEGFGYSVSLLKISTKTKDG